MTDSEELALFRARLKLVNSLDILLREQLREANQATREEMNRIMEQVGFHVASKLREGTIEAIQQTDDLFSFRTLKITGEAQPFRVHESWINHLQLKVGDKIRYDPHPTTLSYLEKVKNNHNSTEHLDAGVRPLQPVQGIDEATQHDRPSQTRNAQSDTETGRRLGEALPPRRESGGVQVDQTPTGSQGEKGLDIIPPHQRGEPDPASHNLASQGSSGAPTGRDAPPQHTYELINSLDRYQKTVQKFISEWEKEGVSKKQIWSSLQDCVPLRKDLLWDLLPDDYKKEIPP